MPLRSIFTKHTEIKKARRQVAFWITIPTAAVVIFVAALTILQSGGVMTTLNYSFSFDDHNSAFINHSLWWVVCMNVAGALLTIAVIGWLVSLYFAYRSLRTYWRVGRPRTKKARQARRLYWVSLAVVAVPIALFIIWNGLGIAVQFVTAPTTPVVAVTNNYTPAGFNYWSSDFIPEILMFALPFCVVISIYCAVKRARL